MIKDFEKSTKTHCRVPNVLPSISAVIADCQPQKFIWHLCFALDSVPRYLIAFLQLQRVLARQNVAYYDFYVLVQYCSSLFHILELTFLLVLSYVSSIEVSWMHQLSFVLFMIFSLLHMLITILIDYFWPRTSLTAINEKEKYLRQRRLSFFLINICSFFISLFFYFSHNASCGAYMYTGYCFFEYIVVLSNVLYHATVMDEWDRRGGQLQIFY